MIPGFLLLVTVVTIGFLIWQGHDDMGRGGAA